MRRNINFTVFVSLVLLTISGCSLGNPFVGEWASSAFDLKFNGDKTVVLSIGNAVSVNLEGTYSYDKEKLTLDIDGHSDFVFSYEFKDSGKTLVLKPENKTGYINTQIEFSKK